MPKHTEKKFKVTSFADIKHTLERLGARQVSKSESHHYYGMQQSKDVTKLVLSENKCEIHILKEQDGTFTLTNTIKVKDKHEGIKWLEDNGFKERMHVKMAHDDYEYDNGIVGLYVINDELLSVILDYPLNQHEKIMELLKLSSAEVIEQPYSQYLKKQF